MNRLFLITFILLSAGCLSAQDNNPIRVVGDTLVGKTIDGESVREVHGNVVITQDELTINCDKAIQHIVKNEAELFGNVVVKQDSLLIYTDNGFYNGNSKMAFSNSGIKFFDGHVHLQSVNGSYYFDEKKAFFYKNVLLYDSISTLTSDSLTYYEDSNKTVAVGRVNVRDTSSILFADSLINLRNDRISYAYNNIIVVDPKNRLLITGDKIEDYQNKKYSRITGHPLLIKLDTTDTGKLDTLVISSMIMETYNDSTKRLTASDSVKIVRDNFASINSYTDYFRNEQHLFTYRKENDLRPPVLWNDNAQLTGDTVNIFLQDNRLQKMLINSHAAIFTKKPAYEFRYDQISGDDITMFFGDNGLRLTEVKGNVLSIYYLYEDDEPNGLLKSSSEEAKIYFENNEVKNVRLYGNPISEFHPENLVAGKEKDFTLPTFLIINNRPTKEELLKNKTGLFKILDENTERYGKSTFAPQRKP